MAFDIFLKMDGIDGESTDKFHSREIEVMSFSWGEAQVGTSGGGSGGGAGKAVLQDFRFAMATSKASPNLILACATGRHSPQAMLTCRSGGFEFLKIKLSDVLVSSYDLGSTIIETGYSLLKSNDPGPTDQCSLQFAKIDVLYTVQRTGETIETTFDQSLA